MCVCMSFMPVCLLSVCSRSVCLLCLSIFNVCLSSVYVCLLCLTVFYICLSSMSACLLSLPVFSVCLSSSIVRHLCHSSMSACLLSLLVFYVCVFSVCLSSVSVSLFKCLSARQSLNPSVSPPIRPFARLPVCQPGHLFLSVCPALIMFLQVIIIYFLN
jgi:hypothetical protein